MQNIKDVDLNIPFIKSRGFECGQTCVAMIIKKFIPTFIPDFKMLNKIIKHTTGKYTFLTQQALLLDSYNIRCNFYEKNNLCTSKENPNYFRELLGASYNKNIKYIDMAVHDWAVEQCRTKGLFIQKSTTFGDLLDLVLKGFPVMIPVDWNTLKKIKHDYLGHFVLINGISDSQVFIHDPDEGPNIRYNKQRLAEAWNHPAISNDYLVAYLDIKLNYENKAAHTQV